MNYDTLIFPLVIVIVASKLISGQYALRRNYLAISTLGMGKLKNRAEKPYFYVKAKVSGITQERRQVSFALQLSYSNLSKTLLRDTYFPLVLYIFSKFTVLYLIK